MTLEEEFEGHNISDFVGFSLRDKGQRGETMGLFSPGCFWCWLYLSLRRQMRGQGLVVYIAEHLQGPHPFLSMGMGSALSNGE